ncbi:unnamed protein product [Cyprideis torosa]|uniref:Uncharacterized protein n=1 Tax=Cyprideis torosa TaxID=163714 RepID=A0A7R8WK66_9CRUS|nr:unnamed protein product [Cyprideis torosa]CAG0896583.1 unnamed protein product [Cyprideis torosa]
MSFPAMYYYGGRAEARRLRNQQDLAKSGLRAPPGLAETGGSGRECGVFVDNYGWLAAYMAQMNPLFGPQLHNTTMWVMRKEWVQKYLSVIERSEVALLLSLSETQVKTWYQNRRDAPEFSGVEKWDVVRVEEAEEHFLEDEVCVEA